MGRKRRSAFADQGILQLYVEVALFTLEGAFINDLEAFCCGLGLEGVEDALGIGIIVFIDDSDLGAEVGMGRNVGRASGAWLGSE